MKERTNIFRQLARLEAAEKASKERERQIDLWGDGPMPMPIRLAVLVEEVGEVAAAMQDETDERVLEEVIQVAAVALRWAEDLILEIG